MSDGGVVPVPAGWELLAPGDALVTRRVKAAGDYWAIAEKVGRRVMSRGIWAPADRILKAQRQAEAERATPEYTRKLEAGRARRARGEADYVLEFARHVVAFLKFHPSYQTLAETIGERVAEHATPVGSGTVARTERIPVAERAEAAMIAWMRHQTTAYDHMTISRDKGARREVRRQLAQRSRELLNLYRQGRPAPEDCPLQAAIAKGPPAAEAPAPRARLRPRPVEASTPAPKPTARPVGQNAPEPTAKAVPARPTMTSSPAAAVAPRAPAKRSVNTSDSTKVDDEMARRAARQVAMRARLKQ